MIDPDQELKPSELRAKVDRDLATTSQALANMDKTPTWQWKAPSLTPVRSTRGVAAVGTVTELVGVDSKKLSQAVSWHASHLLSAVVCDGDVSGLKPG